MSITNVAAHGCQNGVHNFFIAFTLLTKIADLIGIQMHQLNALFFAKVFHFDRLDLQTVILSNFFSVVSDLIAQWFGETGIIKNANFVLRITNLPDKINH